MRCGVDFYKSALIPTINGAKSRFLRGYLTSANLFSIIEKDRNLIKDGCN